MRGALADARKRSRLRSIASSHLRVHCARNCPYPLWSSTLPFLLPSLILDRHGNETHRHRLRCSWPRPSGSAPASASGCGALRSSAGVSRLTRLSTPSSTRSWWRAADSCRRFWEASSRTSSPFRSVRTSVRTSVRVIVVEAGGTMAEVGISGSGQQRSSWNPFLVVC